MTGQRRSRDLSGTESQQSRGHLSDKVAGVRELSIFLLACVALAVASPCRNPRLRSAVLRGDAIRGYVSKDRQPVTMAEVRLYCASKLVGLTSTDKDGMFNIEHLTPEKYRLSIAGWGSARVELKLPVKGYGFHESLMLDRNGSEECVATVSVM